MKNSGSSAKQPSTKATSSTTAPLSDERRLRDALAPYLSARRLQYLAARDTSWLQRALLVDAPPPEVRALLTLLAAVLRPLPTEPITGPADVAALLLVEMAAVRQEQVRVVCLSAQHHVQAIETVYQGTLHSAAVRAIEVFQVAMRHNSAAIILAHNHPAGDPTPSLADLAATQQLIDAGRLLDVPVLDHLIIGRGRWLSLAEESSVFGRHPVVERGGPGPLIDPLWLT